MARSSNDILFKFLGDTKSLDRATKNASKSMGGAQTASLSLTKAMGALGVAFGAREILNFAGDAIQMAVAATEVDARFTAVFGSAEKFRKALEEWGDVAGVTKTDAEDVASSFGNLAQTQGLSAEASADFALKAAELAGDIASFKDLDPEAVFLALNKGLLTTEKEGLKAFDLAISAAEVNTRALAIATADGRDEITKADKAYASYEIAVEQAGKAIGDLEKTQGSTASVQRQLTASIEEAQEEIGRRLLPAYEDMLRLTVQMAPVLVTAADAVGLLVQQLEPLQAVMRAVSGETFDATSALKAYGESVLKLNIITGPAVFGIEKINDAFGAAAKEGTKATKAVKAITVAQLASRNAYITYARGMIDAANATGVLERKAWDGDRIIKIFTGDLFAAARAAQAFRRSSGETIGSLFAGGSGSGQTGFATGGVVPGPRGAPMTATVHGGEEILTPGQQSRSGGGATVTINVTALDPDAAAVAVADALRSYTDRYGPL